MFISKKKLERIISDEKIKWEDEQWKKKRIDDEFERIERYSNEDHIITMDLKKRVETLEAKVYGIPKKEKKHCSCKNEAVPVRSYY